jgi:UDP-N-acetylmuramoylalanine--D-glutamate ligase
MIDLSAIVSGKTYGLLGLGKTGLATLRALQAGGATVYAHDDKQDNPAGVQRLTADTMGQLDALVASPGIPASNAMLQAAKASGVAITSDISLLRAACPDNDIIGITGTNGKSTTTALLGHVLQNFFPTQVGGNIGIPALDLDVPDKNTKIVLELSSYQLDMTADLRAKGAIWLNLTPDHLERHGDMAGYQAAKENLFKTAAKGAVAVIGVDDDYSRAVAQKVRAQGKFSVITVSVAGNAADFPVVNGLLEQTDLNGLDALRGSHNHQNAAMVLVLCRQLYGLNEKNVLPHLKSFPGLPHRQFKVRTINGVDFINDSKATNAEATEKALGAFDDIYWILGGQAKSNGLDGLDAYMPRIREAFLIGEASDRFADWLKQRNVTYRKCGVLEQAVWDSALTAKTDYSRGKQPGTVLLSPACASWDQFKSYEHRGEEFERLVKELAE